MVLDGSRCGGGVGLCPGLLSVVTLHTSRGIDLGGRRGG